MATRKDIRLEAHQKFATLITRNMKCIIMDEESSRIHIRAYFNSEPSEYEIDIVTETAFEITTAVDQQLEATSEYCVTDEPIRNLRRNGYWIFALAEEYERDLDRA